MIVFGVKKTAQRFNSSVMIAEEEEQWTNNGQEDEMLFSQRSAYFLVYCIFQVWLKFGRASCTCLSTLLLETWKEVEFQMSFNTIRKAAKVKKIIQFSVDSMKQQQETLLHSNSSLSLFSTSRACSVNVMSILRSDVHLFWLQFLEYSRVRRRYNYSYFDKLSLEIRFAPKGHLCFFRSLISLCLPFHFSNSTDNFSTDHVTITESKFESMFPNMYIFQKQGHLIYEDSCYHTTVVLPLQEALALKEYLEDLEGKGLPSLTNRPSDWRWSITSPSTSVEARGLVWQSYLTSRRTKSKYGFRIEEPKTKGSKRQSLNSSFISVTREALLSWVHQCPLLCPLIQHQTVQLVLTPGITLTINSWIELDRIPRLLEQR